MAAEIKKEIALEIAHVLFIDIVAYSKMSTDDQSAAVEELNQIVQSTDEFRKAESEKRLLKIATGDGMALVFYHRPGRSSGMCARDQSRVKETPQNAIRSGMIRASKNSSPRPHRKKNSKTWRLRAPSGPAMGVAHASRVQMPRPAQIRASTRDRELFWCANDRRSQTAATGDLQTLRRSIVDLIFADAAGRGDKTGGHYANDNCSSEKSSAGRS